MKATELTPGEQLLYQIHKQLYSGKEVLSPQLMAELAVYVEKANKRMRKPPQAKAKPRSFQASKPDSSLVEEPYFRRLKGKIWNDEDFLKQLGTYLDLVSLARLSQVCLTFNGVYRTNWQMYVSLEYDHIEHWLESHIDFCKAYLSQVRDQIPANAGNWLHLTYEEIVYSLTWKFTKKEITELKTMKKVPNEYDEVFKPFIFLLDRNPSRLKTAEGAVYNKYSDVVLKLIADKSIKRMLAGIPKELIAEKAVLLAISAFNSPLLQDTVVRTLSPALGNLVEWGRALVGYHIIAHPFRVRDKTSLCEDLISFANSADDMIQTYYKAKRGLLTAGLLPKSLEYELTFKLPEIPDLTPPPSTDILAISEELLSKSVLIALDLRSLYTFAMVSQHAYRAVAGHWRLRFIELLISYERFKLENANLLRNTKEFMPGYFASFLNPAVLLLDEVLSTPMYLQLIVSKQLVDQLRTMRTITPAVGCVFDAVCELLGLKPVRVRSVKGEVDIQYPHSQLFLKYSLIAMAEKIMQKPISSQSLSKVESILSTSGDVNRGSGDAYRLALWAGAVILLRKLTNPLLYLDYSSLTSDENVRFTAKWFLKEIGAMLNALNAIRRNALVAVPLRELVQKAKERLREEDGHFRASEYEQIMQLNYVSETAAKLHQRFISVTREGISSGMLEESLEVLLRELKLPGVLQSADQQRAIQMVDTYSLGNSPANKRLSSGNNTARSIVSLLFRSTDAIPSSTLKPDPIDAPLSEFPTVALPLTILYFLSLPEVYLNCAAVNRSWSHATKLHSGVRLHFELSRLDQMLDEGTEILAEVVRRRKVYEERNEALRPTEDSASQLLRGFKQRDISELKRLQKPLAIYNALVAPFVVVMDEKPKRRKTAEGQVELNYWEVAVQMFMKPSIFRKMESVSLTTMSWKKAEDLETMLGKTQITIGSAAGLSQSIGNLVSWVNGIWDYHLASRKYYISLAERKYMTEEQVIVCKVLDECDRANYLLYDFINKSCDDEEYRQFTEEVLRGKE